jgi:hypothetical protein
MVGCGCRSFASSKRLRVEDASELKAQSSVLQLVRNRHPPLSLEHAVLSFSPLRDLAALRGCSRGAVSLVATYLAQATAISNREQEAGGIPLVLANCRKLQSIQFDPSMRFDGLPRLIMHNAASLRSVSGAPNRQALVALTNCPNLRALPASMPWTATELPGNECFALLLERVQDLKSIDLAVVPAEMHPEFLQHYSK